MRVLLKELFGLYQIARGDVAKVSRGDLTLGMGYVAVMSLVEETIGKSEIMVEIPDTAELYLRPFRERHTEQIENMRARIQ